MKILIMNGPNLNLLGEREPGIYGRGTMDDCMEGLRRAFPEVELVYYQSNVEGCGWCGAECWCLYAHECGAA